ncbi:hypothetical protein CYLTODRAFT_423486 [Cylindrobasidium torrendii FP15055 ss-10]|uniref:F-box domain-containing protein n=1 Tax=Cylindrobasidium torrendii FP15055 ss-10 TaxID=1314674 RepID=A0A0D7B827_9AGAR|nr:hypothetical protein CYLTODRAFT_423486 [Cylindrobasidium torrendii FP15055 ss-10]
MNAPKATIHDLPAEIIAIILSHGQPTGILPQRDDAMACVQYACAVSQVSRFWRDIALNVEPAKLIWSYIVEFTHGDSRTAIGLLFIERTRHLLHYFLIQNQPGDEWDPIILPGISHRIQCISVYALQPRLPNNSLYGSILGADFLESFSCTVPDFAEPYGNIIPIFAEDCTLNPGSDYQLFGYPLTIPMDILPASLTRLTLERSYISLEVVLSHCSKTLEELVLRRVVSVGPHTNTVVILPRLVYLELGSSHSKLPQLRMQTPRLKCVALTGRWNTEEILNFRWRNGAPASVNRLVYAMDDMTRDGQYDLLNSILEAFPFIDNIQWKGSVRPLRVLLQRTAIRASLRGTNAGFPHLKALAVTDLFQNYDEVKMLLLWRLGVGIPLRSIVHRAVDEQAAKAIVASYPAKLLMRLGYFWLT